MTRHLLINMRKVPAKIYMVFSLFSFLCGFLNTYTFLVERTTKNNNTIILVLIVDTFIVSSIFFVGLLFFYYRIHFCEGESKKIREMFIDSRGDGRINEKRIDRRYVISVSLCQILLWLPVFLAYYPGLFNYDVMRQIPQYLNGYSTHHPIAHTLYLIFFYYVIGERLFHNVSTGIAFATIVQMVLFSFMLSCSHLFLFRTHVKRSFRIVFVLLTGLLPFVSMLSISHTKDVFFSGFVVTLFTHFCYWINCREYIGRYYNVTFVSCTIGCILFRNNGLAVIVLVSVIVLALSYRNKEYKRLLRLLLIGMTIAICINTALRIGLHATKGSLNETLSIPYQQIANVYNEHVDAMSNDERGNICELIPNVSEYNPHCSDNVKQDARGKDNLKKLAKTWAVEGIKYPQNYIKAFCLLDAGYLCLLDMSYAEIYGTGNRNGILLSDTKDGFGVVHTTHFKRLENLYEELYSNNTYRYVLGLNVLCSPALYFWIIIILLIVTFTCCRKTPRLAFALLIPLLVTILAGPCALPRYALPYIVCIPQLLSVVVSGLL